MLIISINGIWVISKKQIQFQLFLCKNSYFFFNINLSKGKVLKYQLDLIYYQKPSSKLEIKEFFYNFSNMFYNNNKTSHCCKINRFKEEKKWSILSFYGPTVLLIQILKPRKVNQY